MLTFIFFYSLGEWKGADTEPRNTLDIFIYPGNFSNNLYANPPLFLGLLSPTFTRVFIQVSRYFNHGTYNLLVKLFVFNNLKDDFGSVRCNLSDYYGVLEGHSTYSIKKMTGLNHKVVLVVILDEPTCIRVFFMRKVW